MSDALNQLGLQIIADYSFYTKDIGGGLDSYLEQVYSVSNKVSLMFSLMLSQLKS